jgi:hypothetical protein
MNSPCVVTQKDLFLKDVSAKANNFLSIFLGLQSNQVGLAVGIRGSIIYLVVIASNPPVEISDNIQKQN